MHSAELLTRLPCLYQAEEAAVKAGRVKAAGLRNTAYPVWNHWEFRVSYPSLSRELCVEGVYVRLLVDGLDKVGHHPHSSAGSIAWHRHRSHTAEQLPTLQLHQQARIVFLSRA